MRPAAARETRTGRYGGSSRLIQSPRGRIPVQPLVSARVVWPFIAVYRELGCPDELGLEQLGYERASIADPDARLPWSDVQRALRFALERTQRPDLGLLAAEHFASGLFDLLSLPLVQADSALSATLQRIGEAFVAAQPRALTWRQAVRKRIADQLCCDGCSCEAIARSLAVTPRTLLRRLKEEATTFRDELDAVRQEKAVTYLRDTTLSVSELAYLLGFSSVATFHRAFKRWTRTTPGDYRRRVLAPPLLDRATDRKTV